MYNSDMNYIEKSVNKKLYSKQIPTKAIVKLICTSDLFGKPWAKKYKERIGGEEIPFCFFWCI